MVSDIGYDNSDKGFDGNSCAVLNAIGKQSPDIARACEHRSTEEQGAGDQGMMFGYACNETDVLMPLPISLRTGWSSASRRGAARRQAAWLRPDAKSQVTVVYEDDRPVGLDAVVLSTQHAPGRQARRRCARP